MNGSPEEVFGNVVDVLALSDGGVAILDGQAAEVRLFDSTGTYRMSLGKKGQGPGEFDRPRVLGHLVGDTLAVYDSPPMRITRFSSDGDLGRVTTLKDTRNPVVKASFLDDGRLIGQSTLLAPAAALPGPEPRYTRDTAVLTLFTSEGAVHDTVDLVPGLESIVSIERRERSISVFKREPIYGRTNVFAAHGDGIWSAANDRFELNLREIESGRLLRIVRAPGLERRVTEAMTRTLHEQAVSEANTPDDRRRLEAWYAQSPQPEVMPSYDRIVVDSRGRLWLSEWSALDETPRWWVFTADGALLGSVDVPNGVKVLAVRCGSVWGIEKDDLDVSYVVRYRLQGNDELKCN